MPGAVLAALASAFCFALAATLQHREASKVDASGVADLRLLWRLSRRPWWVAGVASDVASMALHVFALSLATLAVVQPLGVTGVVFAVPLAALIGRQRIRRLDVVAALAVVVGLMAILKFLPPSGNVTLPAVGFLILVTGVGVVALIAGTVGGHLAPGRPRALLLAGAAGTAFGLTAVLVRVLLLLARTTGSAPAVIATSVCIAILGIGGYLTMQHAYRAGHFAGSVAVAAVLDPLVAVVGGHVLLHETLPSGVIDVSVIAVAGLVACAGIGLLVRSPAALSLAPPPVAG